MTAGVLQDDPAQKRLAQAGELLGVTCWPSLGASLPAAGAPADVLAGHSLGS